MKIRIWWYSDDHSILSALVDKDDFDGLIGNVQERQRYKPEVVMSHVIPSTSRENKEK